MSRSLRTFVRVAVAASLVLTPGAVRSAAATPIGTETTFGSSARYVGGGTAVARADGQPLVDEGGVVCDDGNGVGVGGACLDFGGGNAVEIADEVAGENVPFQVCVDNSGDGVCTSPDNSLFCPDQVFFSHDDAGAFFNPVGPLPTGFSPGCAGGPWKGYVVMLCEGAHVVGTDAHSHAASSGTATVTSGGEGLGTFCGGMPVRPTRKPYTVGSGARYVAGGTAVVREDGQPTADEGSVVCNNGNNEGVGGFCTSFGGGDAMAVFDAAAQSDVAFQVCVDNDGDGFCTTPDTGPCADVVAFSHDDSGAFYNPVGPLPTGFSPGCGAGAWNGYVVFLCQGTHISGGVGHVHPATTGTGRVTSGGEGLGTFCGGSHAAPSRKRYQYGVTVPGTTGAVHVTARVNCFGCGMSSASITWTCEGACVIDGVPCVGPCTYLGAASVNESPATCPVTGTMTGSIAFPGGTKGFSLTRIGATWLMTMPGATSSGASVVTDPVGNACGGPATLTFVGVSGPTP